MNTRTQNFLLKKNQSFINKFMDFKEDTKKLLNEIREKETKNKCMNNNMNKCMNDELETTNKRLIEIMKTIQDLRVEFQSGDRNTKEDKPK